MIEGLLDDDRIQVIRGQGRGDDGEHGGHEPGGDRATPTTRQKGATTRTRGRRDRENSGWNHGGIEHRDRSTGELNGVVISVRFVGDDVRRL